MKDYKIIEIENIDGTKERHVHIALGDNAFRTFDANNSNSSYISFLRQLSEKNPNDPHYLAWVEAGNNPEDFWTQDDELIEPSEPKEETPQETEGES